MSFFNCFTVYRRSALTLVIIMILAAGSLSAQVEKKDFHPLDDALLFSLDYSVTFSLTDYTHSITDHGWRGTGEYFFSLNAAYLLGLRAYGGSGHLRGEQEDFAKYYLPTGFRTSLFYTGIGIEFGYKANKNIVPYFSGGLTYTKFNPVDNKGITIPIDKYGKIYSRGVLIENIEIGMRYLISSTFAFNLSVTENFNQNDYLDGLSRTNHNDTYFQLNTGFSLILFGKNDSDNDGVEDAEDVCPNTPPDITVDKFGCPTDSDGDGVPDYLDKCPNTQFGTKVDSAGCPLDSDNDGVPDYIDLCPGTPPEVKVDKSGCPIDSDQDGVPDYLDQCPNTPLGVKVDATGCSLDSDGDGVPDTLDKCPKTPPGIKVNQSGCPLDSDEDGVPDYLDKCPDTPPAAKVDSVGCPLDSDGDGVPDYLDDCPNTPRRMKVNSSGCPLDSDGDGVPDYLDDCSNTPRGMRVNSSGCPDDDGDGVPNYLDKCPHTKRGVAVDKNGCPRLPDKILLNTSIYFEPGTAKLSPYYLSVLDKMAEKMKSDDRSRWKIEGFADDISSQVFAKIIAANRADAVLIHFLTNGLNADRFIVVKNHEKSDKENKTFDVGVIITRIK